jgi:hypothetical protein
MILLFEHVIFQSTVGIGQNTEKFRGADLEGGASQLISKSLTGENICSTILFLI